MRSAQATIKIAPARERWVDNLRVALIAGVIVAHVATAYVVDIPWYYDDERNASGMSAVVVSFPTFAGAAFGLGPLFLIAGWFSARSLTHRGPAAFVRSRLVRLGVPLLVFVLLLQPLTDYVGNLRDERGSFLYYLSITEVGVMWFVAALLVFSLAYAGLRLRRPAAGPRAPAARSAAPVLIASATIAVTSFALWQVSPITADVFLNLKIGQWPQGAVLFALGGYAAESGWLAGLSARFTRHLGWVAAGAVLALVALFGAEVAWGDVAVLLNATATGPTIIFAVLDGVLAVSWTLWCVAWFRDRWTGHGPVLDRASRASYATYVVHPLVLTTLMVAFAVVPLPAVAKFLVISVAGLPACYAAGYGLTRIPGVSSVM